MNLEKKFQQIVNRHTASLEDCLRKRAGIQVSKGCTPVNDQRVAQICFSAQAKEFKWGKSFVTKEGNEIRARRTKKTDESFHEFSKIKKGADFAILVIMESPSKDECSFQDSGVTGLAPAVGATGNLFNDYFERVLQSVLRLKPSVFSEDKLFDVYFVETISFPCNLGVNADKASRDAIFCDCWREQGFQEDFLQRLEGIAQLYGEKNCIIFNGCTSICDGKNSIKDEISKRLRQKFVDAPVFSVNHPCSWYTKIRVFEIVSLSCVTNDSIELDMMDSFLLPLGIVVRGLSDLGVSQSIGSQERARAYYNMHKEQLFFCEYKLIFDDMPASLQPSECKTNMDFGDYAELIKGYAKKGRLKAHFVNTIYLALNENAVFQSGDLYSKEFFVSIDIEGKPISMSELLSHIENEHYYQLLNKRVGESLKNSFQRFFFDNFKNDKETKFKVNN